MEAMHQLRPGDRVMLRPPGEILATLDANATLAGLPFMPEMLAQFGRVLTVAKRAGKICDTICPIASRRMHDAVYLEDLRCDGLAHGGCEAECRLYWKDAWLVRAGEGAAPVPDAAALAALAEYVAARTQLDGGAPGAAPCFRCQATEARRATEPMGTWSPGQYAREITSGNVTTTHFLRVAVLAGIAAVESKLRHWLRRPAMIVGARSPTAPLGLVTGDWVEVKSAEEIARTLDRRSMNRGLLFAAAEMTPACGKRFQVRRRVDRIIDERSGRMLRMANDCIVLEGFVCTGDRSHRRWFCGREIYPYWREAWLRRAAPVPVSAEGGEQRSDVAVNV